MSQPAIEITELSRHYTLTKGVVRTRRETLEALTEVNLRVNSGEVFGLLGPNGAGKTTLAKVISTILLPTSGNVRVLGFDVVEHTDDVRQRIGLVLGGERGLYYRLTAKQMLEYWAALYRIKRSDTNQRVASLLELVGLSERATERIEGYSRGMKQRLHLARGLINHPQLVILDEPTVGLDPIASNSVRDIIRRLTAKGVTVFLTTHYMAEADALCDRVAFIKGGKIVALDRPTVLKNMADDILILNVYLPHNELLEINSLKRIQGVSEVSKENFQDGQRFVVRADSKKVMSSILKELSNFNVEKVNSVEPTLEDLYIRLIGDRGMTV